MTRKITGYLIQEELLVENTYEFALVKIN